MSKKKQIKVRLSDEILSKIDSKMMNKIISKGVETYPISNQRKKIYLYLNEETYAEIKNIKKATKEPYWRIVEKIFEIYLGSIEPEKQIETQTYTQTDEEHIPPAKCPECGSDDLLISNNNTWYCYGCTEDGDF